MTTTDTLTVEPIRADLGFGARVRGVTRAGLEDTAVRARLNELFEQYGLLVFQDVEPSPAMQVALSNVFGPLKDHPSKAVARAGGDDMLGVIEMRHDPSEPPSVRLGDRLLSS